MAVTLLPDDVPVESNPFNPQIPDSIRQLSPDLYAFLQDQVDNLRQQHTAVQAGDPANNWSKMLAIDLTPRYTLGSVGHFYNPTYGVFVAVYVQFGKMQNRQGPVSRIDNEWTVSNDWSVTLDRKILGALVASTVPTNDSYGWVLLQGTNLNTLTLEGDKPTRGQYVTWESNGALLTDGTSFQVVGQIANTANIESVDNAWLLGPGTLLIDTLGGMSNFALDRLKKTVVDVTPLDYGDQIVSLEQRLDFLNGLNRLSISRLSERISKLDGDAASIQITQQLSAAANFANLAQAASNDASRLAGIVNLRLAATNQLTQQASTYRTQSGFYSESAIEMATQATLQANSSQVSADASATHALDSKTSADAAGVSARASETSRLAAGVSEGNSADSATESKSSAQQAAESQTSAAAHDLNADNSAKIAVQKATEAATSAEQASDSATQSATSATNSHDSEVASSQSAAAASNSERLAAGYAQDTADGNAAGFKTVNARLDADEIVIASNTQAVAQARTDLTAAYESADNATLAGANQYTDGATATALAGAKTYADAQVSKETQARSDAVSAVTADTTNMKSEYRAYPADYTAKDAANLTAANTYADGTGATALSNAKTYTDAGINSEASTRAAADSAQSTRSDQMTATYTAYPADYAAKDAATLASAKGYTDNSVQTATADYTSKISTQAGRIDATNTNLGNLTGTYNAFIANQYNPLSNQVTALGTNYTNLSATVGGNSANISSLQGVLATNAGGKALAVLQLNVNGYVSGYKTTNDGSTSSFNILASQFSVSDGTTTISPFAVMGGVVYMTNVVISGSLIINGTVNTPQLASNSVTSLNAVSLGSLDVSQNADANTDDFTLSVSGSPVSIDFQANPYRSSTGTGLLLLILYARRADNSTVALNSILIRNTLNGTGTPVGFWSIDTPPAGTARYFVGATMQSGGGSTYGGFHIDTIQLRITELKR